MRLFVDLVAKFACGLVLPLLFSAGGASASQFEVLHRFTGGSDGEYPVGLTFGNADQLIGTTFGADSAPGKQCSKGCRYGTAYKATQGRVTPVHQFLGGDAGYGPSAPLVYKDTIYGSTFSGGAYSNGLIYKSSFGGREKILYSFCAQTNCVDGSFPYFALIADGPGNLYGVTQQGGAGVHCTVSSGCGTVFRLGPDGTETVLYSFCNQKNCADGYDPSSGLVADGSGNLYGTTNFGGSGAGCSDKRGCGTLFRVAPDGGFTVLYSFCGQPNCTDGQYPINASLILDSTGDIYGTTSGGGSGSSCTDSNGCGTVFQLAPDGTEAVLYSFCNQANCADGYYPDAGVIADNSGVLYGTTGIGGQVAGCGGGCGTVFSLAPGGTETVLHSFCSEQNCRDGAAPQTTALLLKANDLFGVTSILGADTCRCGTIFEIKKN